MQPPMISPDHLREDIEEGDTITALLHRAERKETARMEGNFLLRFVLFKGVVHPKCGMMS